METVALVGARTGGTSAHTFRVRKTKTRDRNASILWEGRSLVRSYEVVRSWVRVIIFDMTVTNLSIRSETVTIAEIVRNVRVDKAFTIIFVDHFWHE